MLEAGRQQSRDSEIAGAAPTTTKPSPTWLFGIEVDQRFGWCRHTSSARASYGLTTIMDYTPRHAQPFTFAQLAQLDIPTIAQGQVRSLRWDLLLISAAEIGRLENSLQHLTRTQEELQAHLENSEDDPDLREALEYNKTVMCVILHIRCFVVAKPSEVHRRRNEYRC